MIVVFTRLSKYILNGTFISGFISYGNILPFNKKEVSKLLAECHRRCCICHRFCGIKIETDHIKPKSEKGSDKIENAIPLCYECHSEVHMYNHKHPRGRKYQLEELLFHKKQWLEICEQNPNILINEMKVSDSGPIMSLLSELEYNRIICGIPIFYEIKEFQHSISNGILSFLDENLKENIMATYAFINLTNLQIEKFHQTDKTLYIVYEQNKQEVLKKQKETDEIIIKTIKSIKEFLNKE